MIDCFYSNHQLFIITEKLGANLYDYFIKPKVIPHETQLRKILECIFATLNAIHDMGVIHCDIKPENITLIPNDDSKVKLIDYGSALLIEDTGQHCELQTLPYRAPEIVLRADYTQSIDIWSVGCIIYEMVTTRVLFDCNEEG